MYDNAIAREKLRTAEKKPDKKQPTKSKQGDPATLAGVERGDEMTRAQANEGKVNPGFMEKRGCTTNCQSCVVAFEARLRGYDVQTKGNHENPTAKMLSRQTNKAWIDPATGKNPEFIQDQSVTTAKRCKTWMNDTIQTGERYTFEFPWRGRGNTGHIISVDKDSSGALRFYDPQNGKTYKGAEIDSYLGLIKFSRTYNIGGRLVVPLAKMLRVDNLQIDPNIASGIMEATGS